jgi:hypothetical protein
MLDCRSHRGLGRLDSASGIRDGSPPGGSQLDAPQFTSRGDRPGIYDRNKALQRMQRRHPEKSIPAPQIMNNTLGSLFRRRSRIQASEPCSSCVGLADLPYVDGLGQSPRPGVRPRHRRARTAASRTTLLSFGAWAASSSYDDLGRLPGSGVIRPARARYRLTVACETRI